MQRGITVFILFVSFVVLGGLTTYCVAQSHAGDCVGVGADGQLYQVDPLGRVTTHKIGSGALHGWTMDYDNRNMLVTDRDARCIYLVAAHAGQGLWRLDLDHHAVSRMSFLMATLYEVGFRGERNLGSARVGPRQWSVNVTFPGEGGGIYLVALGHSGVRPPLRLPDGRRLWLVPDALTLATVAGPLPPFVMGNLGTLDASGRAFVTLDLSTLPTNANGVLVWLVAATLDPAAPSGLRTITDPMVFRIE